MNINLYHKNLIEGDHASENRLFQNLSERFSLFLQHKVQNKQDAEEILQDTLMTISVKYRSIEFETSFSAWAHKVLTNNILMYYRTKGRKHDKLELLDNPGEQLASREPDRSIETSLLDCLKKLNKANQRHARILNLNYQGYSVDEILTRLNLTRNSFYILLHRARKVLKACLDDKGVRP